MKHKITRRTYKCGHPKVGVRCKICKAAYNRQWAKSQPIEKRVELSKKALMKYHSLDPDAKAEYIRKVRQRKEKRDARNTNK